jgi:tetratricopeptide (TPR) repeat protein
MTTRYNLMLSLINNRACESFHLKDFDLSLRQLEKAENILHKRYRLTCVSGGTDHGNKKVTAKPTINKECYNFQRLDFDEGFSDCCETELTQPEMSTSILQATILYNKAQIQLQYGNLDEATSCISLSLSILREKASSRLEILALSVMGQILYRQGSYQKAALYYKKVMRCSKEQGDVSLHTISSALNCLSILYYHMISNENEERYLNFAIKCAERALKIRIQLYGNHHLAVATSYNNIGRLYAARKRFHDAMRCYKKALDIRHEAGKDLDYAATAFNAGKSFQQLNELDTALEYYSCFLKIAVQYFSKSHRDIANVLTEIAMIEQQRGHPEEALKLQKESLEIYQITLGKVHPETRFAWNRLSEFYVAQGSYDAALEAIQMSLKGETNINQRLVLLYHMGELYREKREYHHAITSFKKLLSIQKILATQSTDIAITLHAIGVTYTKEGRLDEAMRYLRQAVSCYNFSCLDATPSMIALAVVLTRIYEFKEAMDLLKEVFAVRSRELGPDHKCVAFTLYHMAIIYQKKGLFSEAITLFKEVLRVERLVLGKEHKNVVLTILKLGRIFKEIYDFDRALPYFLEALYIQRKFYKVFKPQVIARTLIDIGDIHLAQGRASSMMELFSDADRIYQKIFFTNREDERYHCLYLLSLRFGAPAA